MVETEDAVITAGGNGWSNANAAPVAVGLVGSRPTQRRVVAILLLFSALTFGGTLAAEASACVMP